MPKNVCKQIQYLLIPKISFTILFISDGSNIRNFNKTEDDTFDNVSFNKKNTV